jgi:hypothetical protein
MDFQIDLKNIEKSFDLLAKQLLLNHALEINNRLIEITEIEFYFFKEGIHEDKYTHLHDRNAGEWRLHNQGIDITFQSTNDQDGGILIRGIKHDGEYTNGPLKTLNIIFKNFGNVESTATLRIVEIPPLEKKILKTFRHLPNKIEYPDFHNSYYRYLIDLDFLKLDKKSKEMIIQSHTII